jgi:signal transduction histidine kinase
VASHLELLARKVADRLDEREREHLGFAVDGAKRMQALITSLLRLAHAGRDELRLADVPAEEALAEAEANVAMLAAETGGTITHDPLPLVRADRASLVELLQNLLVNGLKYRRDGEPPRLHVGAARGTRPGWWELAVRDNGVGIDPRDHQRIFEVFQRAEDATLRRGSGLGLAVCKRIVERHHGRIWVESAKDAGATFRFTLEGCGP